MRDALVMPLDWIIRPVTVEAPCGPDLEQVDDPEFVDYYFEAEARLPERYFVPGSGGEGAGAEDRLFDPRSVHLRRETETITGLLHRSRDLRLLSLLARFQILAGRLSDFVETLEATAHLLSERTDKVHPQPAHNLSDRRRALDALSEQTSVIMPLMHLSIIPNAGASYRRHLVATGQVEPRRSEGELSPDEVIAALKNPANAAAVADCHAQLGRAAQALAHIRALCAAEKPAFTPDFGPALDIVTSIQAVIAAARPELMPWTEAAGRSAVIVAHAVSEGTGGETATVRADVPAGPAALIQDRGHASAALEAAERYLAVHEPSSPALLLVAQARLLIGRPLVEAIETLLPAQAGSVVLRLGGGAEFALGMDKLKLLSEAGLSAAPAGDTPARSLEDIADRPHLTSYLTGVESFYLRSEPASPIPLLLARARDMMAKPFDTLLTELLPQGNKVEAGQ